MFFKQNRDFFQVLLFLFLAAIVVYTLPAPLNRFVFLLIYPVVWYSKKDYFWFAFFFLLTETPGGFFKINTDIAQYKLFFTVASGVSFTFNEVYLLLMMVKVLVKKRYRNRKTFVYFRRNLKSIGVLFILLVIITPLLGMNYFSIKDIYKISIKLTLFYTIFRIFPDMETMKKLLRILIPFTFVALLFQIYSLLNYHQLGAGLVSGLKNVQGIYSGGVADKLQRPIELVHVLLINFTVTFYLLQSNEMKFSKNYLWLINILSFLSILMTATRTWFIAFLFAYVFFLFLTRGDFIKWLVRLGIIAVFVVVMSNLIPVLEKQLTHAWTRLETVQMIASGDVTAGGTAKRFDKRAPKVMDGFWNSSILLGAGFSENHHKNQDFHIGYHNLLLNVGIFGVVVFFLLIWKLLSVSFKARREKSIHTVSTILLVTLLILNTATQFIGFNVIIPSRFYIQAFTLLFMSTVYNYHLIQQRRRA